MKWKIKLLYFFTVFVSIVSFAQENATDSLQRVVATHNDDSLKVNALISLATAGAQSEPQKAIEYAIKAKELATKVGYKKGLGYAYKWMGIINNYKGKYFEALDYSNKSLNVFESIGDEVGISNLLNNLGYFYGDKGKDPKALEYYQKSLQLARKHGNKLRIATALQNIGVIYFKNPATNEKALEYYLEALPLALEVKDQESIGTINTNIGEVYLVKKDFDKALFYFQQAEKVYDGSPSVAYTYNDIGKLYRQKKDYTSALIYYNKAYEIANKISSTLDMCQSFIGIAQVYMEQNLVKDALAAYKKALTLAQELNAVPEMKEIYEGLSTAYAKTADYKSAYSSQTLLTALYNTENDQKLSFNTATFEYNIEIQKQLGQYNLLMKEKALQKLELEKEKFAKNASIAVLSTLMVIALILLINNMQRKKLNRLLYKQKGEIEVQKRSVEEALANLKITQSQLVQSEKMASLGELTAGIAHEIQNPLNFINNFSDLNTELIEEMLVEMNKGNTDEVKGIASNISNNEQKINHHGKRADSIVKGMLQHSRTSTGKKEPTDINALADECLRLSYHGLRSKDNSFNATLQTDFDASIGKANINPQDVGRVILNLVSNAFYSVSDKKKKLGDKYEPIVSVSTKKAKGKIEVHIKDNGNGIPQKVLDKIFQPFFTTKPTGHGTGLGLSLSYDIVKAHGGEINVETIEGEGVEFIIVLPVSA
ncbi:MAG: tetratricopeptide repeat protein [Ferruginibacter sp.]|nr:tetratricopeptide repeat protein [Ferruginibacter sp.]